MDYYYRNFSGIGLKASYYFGNSSFNNVNQLDENNNVIGNGLVSDNINYLFIGPSLIFRVPFYNYRYLDVIKLCPGYIRYYNEAVRFDTPITYEGNTFGFIFSACLDFEINSHLSMGIEPRFSFGGLRKMKINDKIETLDSKESLMKVEVSAHFKIH